MIITQGATVVDAGSSVPLNIRIANRNPVPLSQVQLEVTYPSGTYLHQDTTVRLPSQIFSGIVLSPVRW